MAEGGDAADQVGAQAAANALLGVQRALIDFTRRRVLAGDDPARLAAEVRQRAEAAFALLEHGLGGYAPRPPG